MNLLLLLLASSETVEFTPDAGADRNVGTGCGQLGATAAYGATGGGQVTRHTIKANVSRPVVRLESRQVGATATTTVRCQARVEGSAAWTPVTFGGNPSAILAPADATLTSDPIPLDILRGQRLEFMTWGHADTNGSGAAANEPTYPGVDAGYASNTSWEALPGASLYDATGGRMGLRPTGIIAPSGAPSWLVCGDSIFAASGINWGVIGMRARGNAYTLCARSGEASMHLAADRWDMRLAGMLPYVDRVLWEYGINDCQTDGDQAAIAAMKTNAVKNWLKIHSTSSVDTIVASVLLPEAKTTDSWQTLDGQTPGHLNRVPYNDWLRDGAPILNGAPTAVGDQSPGVLRAARKAGGAWVEGDPAHPLGRGFVFDAGGVVESSVNSGKYRAGLAVGPDGLHPARPVHDEIGAAFAQALAERGM